jgi:hypothetical protein
LDEWLAPFRASEIDSDPTEAICEYVRRKIEFSRTNPEAARLFCLEIVRGAPLIGPELRTSLKELVDAKAAVIGSRSETGRLAPVDPYYLIFTIWSTTQHYCRFRRSGPKLLWAGACWTTRFSSKLCAIPRPLSSTALSRNDARHGEWLPIFRLSAEGPPEKLLMRSCHG